MPHLAPSPHLGLIGTQTSTVQQSHTAEATTAEEHPSDVLARLSQIGFSLGHVVKELSDFHTERLDRDSHVKQDAAEHLDELEDLVRVLRQIVDS